MVFKAVAPCGCSIPKGLLESSLFHFKGFVEQGCGSLKLSAFAQHGPGGLRAAPVLSHRGLCRGPWLLPADHSVRPPTLLYCTPWTMWLLPADHSVRPPTLLYCTPWTMWLTTASFLCVMQEPFRGQLRHDQGRRALPPKGERGHDQHHLDQEQGATMPIGHVDLFFLSDSPLVLVGGGRGAVTAY